MAEIRPLGNTSTSTTTAVSKIATRSLSCFLGNLYLGRGKCSAQRLPVNQPCKQRNPCGRVLICPRRAGRRYRPPGRLDMEVHSVSGNGRQTPKKTSVSTTQTSPTAARSTEHYHECRYTTRLDSSVECRQPRSLALNRHAGTYPTLDCLVGIRFVTRSGNRRSLVRKAHSWNLFGPEQFPARLA